MQNGTFAARYDDVISDPKMRALYGDSGYFNVGYWSAATKDLVSACDALVDQVAAPISAGARVVLDVGCGLGAGTRRLAARFPRARVVGANLSLWQLRMTRGRGARAVATDAARLGVASNSADAVVALESALHFDTRDDFFREAFRVLRPGGVLSTADMLFRDADVIGPWMVPAPNRIADLREYEEHVRAAGFTSVASRDVTPVTWTPYIDAMSSVFEDQNVVRAIASSVSHYLLLTAVRP
jgi:cyclopropane fatty-acyl-phospholipid synthase-like methyltransferase